jgi:hypothetical protein
MSTAEKRRPVAGPDLRAGLGLRPETEVREELETAGWQRRFEAEAVRAGELVDLYARLGYEVTTRQIAPQEVSPDCAGCAIVACQRYIALYTRRPMEGVSRIAQAQ